MTRGPVNRAGHGKVIVMKIERTGQVHKGANAGQCRWRAIVVRVGGKK